MQLDITMTSLLRPEVIEETLSSLKKNLKFSGDIRLFLSIDPIGSKIKSKEIYKLASKYFFTIPKYNIEASFENAVLWLWNSAESNYFLHWEDDKLLLRKVDLDWCIEQLEKRPDVASISFPSHKIKVKDKIFYYVKWHLDKGLFITEDYGSCFGTRPHLIRNSFIKGSLNFINNKKNIEKQFRYSKKEFCKMFLYQWKFSLYPHSSIYQDIGNDWKKKMNLKKSREKVHKYIVVSDGKFDSHNY
jgi:hypothetical protein